MRQKTCYNKIYLFYQQTFNIRRVFFLLLQWNKPLLLHIYYVNLFSAAVTDSISTSTRRTCLRSAQQVWEWWLINILWYSCVFSSQQLTFITGIMSKVTRTTLQPSIVWLYLFWPQSFLFKSSLPFWYNLEENLNFPKLE